MKILNYILIASFAIAVSCKDNKQPEVKTVDTTPTKEVKTIAVNSNATFTVEGMSCAVGCAALIEKNLAKLDGVKEAKVDFESKLATISFDDAIVSTEKITETVTASADGSSYTVHDMNKTALK